MPPKIPASRISFSRLADDAGGLGATAIVAGHNGQMSAHEPVLQTHRESAGIDARADSDSDHTWTKEICVRGTCYAVVDRGDLLRETRGMRSALGQDDTV